MQQSRTMWDGSVQISADSAAKGEARRTRWPEMTPNPRMTAAGATQQQTQAQSFATNLTHRAWNDEQRNLAQKQKEEQEREVAKTAADN